MGWHGQKKLFLKYRYYCLLIPVRIELWLCIVLAKNRPNTYQYSGKMILSYGHSDMCKLKVEYLGHLQSNYYNFFFNFDY